MKKTTRTRNERTSVPWIKAGAPAIAALTAVIFQAVAATDTPAARRSHVAELVRQVQRADYEGDRPGLRRLYDSLAPFRDDKRMGAPVGYWRGFALWRRAFNGFNEAVDPAELALDLESAIQEFEASVRRDPAFVESKVAALSCLSGLLFLNKDDAARVRDLVQKGRTLLKETQPADPENPRLLWVLGGNQWYSPPERGGGEASAFETYRKGLQSARRRKASNTDDALLPQWGEPELLMNLAWSNLHRQAPDLPAAEQFARQALTLVPYWHYLRDILLPQIQEAQRKQNRRPIRGVPDAIPK